MPIHPAEILQADAGTTDACVGAVPARIVVACGIFGNITRHRRAPDLPTIRYWFSDAGFREEAFDISQDGFMSVGANRLVNPLY